MTNERRLRQFLIEQPFAIAEKMPEILSMNIVGSFAESQGIEGISDIDTIIIVDHLTQWKFDEIVNKFKAVKLPLKKEFGLNLKTNITFGPLKYNEPNTVVYHVMVYDVARHIVHCKKSPFTCFDWQRTKLYAKSHISDIYKVRCLMPHYFFNARRGIKEYLSDYKKSVVSYRSYNFIDGEVVEKYHEKKMTNKDRCEFAFHIIRFVMANFLKMIHRTNTSFQPKKLLNQFLEIVPEFTAELPKWFNKLYEYKMMNRFPEKNNGMDLFVEDFLLRFERAFYRFFPSDDKYICFCRHERTELNDGTLFMGQKLNPSIGYNTRYKNKTDPEFDMIISSPLKRARQTAQLRNQKSPITIEPLLLEIDYGEAEGRDYEWLCKNHPATTEAWNKGQDQPFPKGQSQTDVKKRVSKFLSGLTKKKNARILAVTHNVWLRVLLGMYLGVKMKNWHKLVIPHNHLLRFRYHPDDGVIPDLTTEDVCTITKNIDIENFLNLQSSYDRDSDERYQFWKSVYAKSDELFSACHEEYDGTALVPMAGEGLRYKKLGFATPKPLVNVNSQPMISQVSKSLPKTAKSVYLIRDFMITDKLASALKKTTKQLKIVPVKQLTKGQACTCLLGINEATPNKPLLVAPCDNAMMWNDKKYQALLADSSINIICWTFTKHLSIKAKPQAWGYIAADEQGNATKVSVKIPMTSNPYNEHCIIGTFWFKTAGLFKNLAEELIEKNIRVNNEFYVDSIMELAIQKNIKVKIFDVDKYISWGRPEDLFEYRKWMEIIMLYS